VLVEPPQPVLNEHPDPVFDPGSQPPPPPTPVALTPFGCFFTIP
jgi:hypothetical protein